MQQCRRWIISGKVQGVGFRPFIHQLAHRYELQGWVRNNLGEVEIQCQGDVGKLDKFQKDIIYKSPHISEPILVSSKKCHVTEIDGFEIKESESTLHADIHIPTDFYTCLVCLVELQNETDRRYRYPFINCTQCGPRYTLIESLPYDRANTSMHEFDLCDACLEEYQNPFDRRFHAEPVACPVCGPNLSFKDKQNEINDNEDALTACVDALKNGQIVAVKGIGGYHLICDAANDSSVEKLRNRKGRPHKPLAVMFPSCDVNDSSLASLSLVNKYLTPSEDEARLLASPARPIVLTKRKANTLSALIAPGLNEIGAMFAYSPLHQLLLEQIGKPLVATSANISGEPVLIDQSQVESRLAHITSNYLHHNRRIVRPADDSVFRKIAGKLRPIRLGRGHAPVELQLPFHLKQPMLACGSHMKNTIALAWDNRLVVSAHIGDLDSPCSMEVFNQTISDLQKLYRIDAAILACDAHPAYASTRWAKNSALPYHQVQHHRAHASALYFEYIHDDADNEPWLVFCWDGTGFGDDATIWGAEAFYGFPGNWQRVGSFRPFNLPGGDKASREPWRSAAALSWELGQTWQSEHASNKLLKQAWEQGINSPQSSAMGRLFDAAAALTGIIQFASFEGQAPMQLEQQCAQLYASESLPIQQNSAGVFIADWAEIIEEMVDNEKTKQARATLFHSRIAHTLLEQAQRIREKHPFQKVGISGGVFQNRKLSDYVFNQLDELGFEARMATKLPVNDAGISTGQIIEAAVVSNNIRISSC